MGADDGIWKRFSDGSMQLFDVLLQQSTEGTILDSLARIVGETLGVDRSLIFDISLSQDHARAMTEWLNPAHPEVTPTKATYPLQLFRASTRWGWETREMLDSQATAPHATIIEDRVVELLHGGMNIQSLLWYPFAFRSDGFFMLAFNHVVSAHAWTSPELEFIRTAARHVTMALVKLDLEEGLRGRNEQLRRSLREKEVLLHEIHHRVRNNLQTIVSLLHLQVGLAPEGPTRTAMIESENRVHSIALAHDLLYESDDLASIDLSDYLQAVVRQVRYTGCNETSAVEAIVVAQDLHLDIELVVSCGLIVTELVTNALCHAFPDGASGHVWITVARHDHQIFLEVHDDGVGLTAGTAAGFGLQLVRTLAQRLGGQMALVPNHGTIVRVQFPVHEPAAAAVTAAIQGTP